MSNTSNKKVILVIGATGAQGLAVIDALLKQSSNGSPSPYSIRALTRNPESLRARQLTQKGVECVVGSFMDFAAVKAALKGVYGAFVNTDGFSVNEQEEIYAGMRIFELAKEVGTVQHYVWSNTDYVFKMSGYDPKFACPHSDGKGRVGEWISIQPSGTGANEMTWSQLTTGPYMDMLNTKMLGPVNIRADGTHVFATPIGHGHMPIVSLEDIGFFARYIFDNRAAQSARDLVVASELLSWPKLVDTFTRVTGKKAVFVAQSIEEWFTNFVDVDIPVAIGGGGVTWREDFTGWWNMYSNDTINAKRDMEWIRRVNPDGDTVERWMRRTNYQGKSSVNLLKDAEETGRIRLNIERVTKL